jgi:NAD(P)-dependent dehydrogenase (short-subunit alcohol dehydrogenase family)
MTAAVSLPATPSFRLDGRRALVTGAGRGLGLAMAAALAEAGADVTLVARSGEEIAAVADAIRQRGERAETLTLDVTDTARVAAEVAARGPFQILVNNAGVNRPADFVDITEADYDAVTDLNVRAAVFMAQTVAKGLIADGLPGSIINVSSQMGHVGGPKRTVYCATKHALEGATKAMAWELGQHGIRVNTLCPTFIETPLTAPMLADAEFRDYVGSNIALGRVGRVEDVMGAAVYLASDASGLVTGSAIMVDGGWTAA